jgi:hypothetical protein
MQDRGNMMVGYNSKFITWMRERYISDIASTLYHLDTSYKLLLLIVSTIDCIGMHWFRLLVIYQKYLLLAPLNGLQSINHISSTFNCLQMINHI